MKLPQRLPESGKWGALFAWLNELRDSVDAQKPLASHNVRVTHTRVGTGLLGVAAGVSESSPGGGMNYRGTWTPSPPSSYREFDVVIVQTGPSAGTYISVTSGNDNNPATGNGWVQIAPGDAFGRWS